MADVGKAQDEGGMGREWSDEEIQHAFLLEVRERFDAENARWRADEVRSLEEFKRDNPDDYARYANEHPHIVAVRDSFLWELYQGCEFRWPAVNAVEVVMPDGFGLSLRDLKDMFDNTEMGWGLASVEATIIDGRPRVVVSVVLVDGYDDDRHREWERDHGKRFAR